MALVSLHVEFVMVIMIILGSVVLPCLAVMIAREALRPSASLLTTLGHGVFACGVLASMTMLLRKLLGMVRRECRVLHCMAERIL